MSDEYRLIRTLHTYCHALDEGDLDWLMTLYDDDCLFELRGTSNDIEQVAGADAIRALYAKMVSPEGLSDETRAWNRGSHLGKHVCMNPIVRIDGDRAWSQADWRALRIVGPPTGEGIRAGVAGRWNDQLRRNGDRWLFTYRRIFTQVPPVSDPMLLVTPADYR